MIVDPTLEHYIYYLRRVEGDNDRTALERRAAFEKELKALLVHLSDLSDQAIPVWEWPQESKDRHISQRIVRTGWLDHPKSNLSCFVEARTYGDVYSLQVGYCLRGECRPEAFASLRNEVWKPSDVSHLLGHSGYLCGIATEGSDELAARAMAAYAGNEPDAFVPIHLTDSADNHAWLYSPPQLFHTAVLLYPNERSEKWAGRIILNDIALRLELYKHKADRQLAWCEENLPALARQERSLYDHLDELAPDSPVTLKHLQQLAQSYRVFTGNIGMLTERQTTIEINLDNLDAVLGEMVLLAKDRPLLTHMQDRLRQRQKQLVADLTYAHSTRRQVEDAINALGIQLGLKRLAALQADTSAAVIRTGIIAIERSGFPGTPCLFEPEMRALTSRPKTSQPAIYPQIDVSPLVKGLQAGDRVILQKVYRGFGRVLVEKQFSGGYSGSRVLLTLPITTSNLHAARKVTKVGSAPELRKERDNYEQYVEDFLPFCVARVEADRYHEQDNQAGLSYIFVGGGALGQVMEMEEYYHSTTPRAFVRTLEDLLDKELGQRWYSQATPLNCFFAAEYSQHMAEHLRLRLRPDSSDSLWFDSPPPVTAEHYERVEIEDIPHKHETIQPGTLLVIDGLSPKRIKRTEVTLQDSDGKGVIIGVEFVPGGSVPEQLSWENRVGVRGEVIYNRHGRMEQIIRAVFPDLSPGIESDRIRLPDVPRVYPNPLRVYAQVLNSVLEGKQSYVHGDLHLRNALVDECGKGWLIDFAHVAKRHNLFDFIKLETYIREAGLGKEDAKFSLHDYVRFEEALVAATKNPLRKFLAAVLVKIGVGTPLRFIAMIWRLFDPYAPPNNLPLLKAYQVIMSIRRIAREYMAQESSFSNEYFPALFLYCLGVAKYYKAKTPKPARLAIATAIVLGRHLPGIKAI